MSELISCGGGPSELLAQPLLRTTPVGFALDEVEVRLARPDERVKWDALMDRHHYLGFKRFAGRGLHYVAEWGSRWLSLAGWQVAALKCAPRDRWIGWRRTEMFQRLHLVANNTQFVVPGERCPRRCHSASAATATAARRSAAPPPCGAARGRIT